MRKNFFIGLMLLVQSLWLAIPAALAVNSDYGLGKTSVELGYNQSETVYTMVNKVVVGSLSLLGLIFLGMMLYAGIRWMTARGNEELSGKATHTLTAAVIGIMVVLSSYGITKLIFRTVAPAAPVSAPAPVQGDALSDGAQPRQGCCLNMSKGQVSSCQPLSQSACGSVGGEFEWESTNCEDTPRCKVGCVGKGDGEDCVPPGISPDSDFANNNVCKGGKCISKCQYKYPDSGRCELVGLEIDEQHPQQCPAPLVLEKYLCPGSKNFRCCHLP